MKFHQLIFSRIRGILQKHFDSNLIISEENDDISLELRSSNLWINCDNSELIVGFRGLHRQFCEDYDNIGESVDFIYNILTNEIKITKYIKGTLIYKVICEIDFGNSKSEILGSSSDLFYPFWKETKIEVIIFNRLLDKEKVLPDFEKLKKDLEETEDKILLKLMLEAKEEGFTTEEEFYKALNFSDK